MKKLNTILLIILLVTCFVALVVPIGLAVLWALVDPEYTWSYPDLFPKKLSLDRFVLIWNTSSLKQSIINSYSMGLAVMCSTLLLSMPTAYAIGRFEFKGKGIIQVIILLPLIVPSFVIGIFFSSCLFKIGIYSKFWGILIGHTVLFLPYSIRILSVSFSMIRDELIQAAQDLGASRISILKNVYLPTLKSGILSALIIVLIRSLEEFALSFIIGSPDFTTVPTILYSYLGYQFIRPNAAVVSLVLVIPNIILMMFLERALKT